MTYRRVDTATIVLSSVGLAGVWALCEFLPGRLPRDVFPWVTVAVVAGIAVATGRWARGAYTRAVDARVRSERERLALDLHDGLAQDLALIALHGDRLSAELGTEHPVAVAARRALAVTRGTMIDLAASAEPTTLDALHAVAEELESRYPVDITVSRLDGGTSGAEFSPETRHQVVRIAREALVNAVRHGSATRVTVGLGAPDAGEAILRVADDGVGIAEARARGTGTGLGLPSMRRRAGILDARLLTRRGEAGGTEVIVRS